jgi:L-lysine exporter family protein LysE/ArgO
MTETGLIIFLTAVTATFIGAVPLGLVNLSVIERSMKNDIRRANQIAYGASVVEILFALIALLIGTKLSPIFEGNTVVRYFVFGVLLVTGLFYLFKKNKGKYQKEQRNSPGFLKGVILNLISIQVFLYWLVVSTVLSAKHLLPISIPEFLLFLTGVGLAKTGVLKGYAFVAQKVANRVQIISDHVNRIIGVVLLAVAVIQFIKF